MLQMSFVEWLQIMFFMPPVALRLIHLSVQSSRNWLSSQVNSELFCQVADEVISNELTSSVLSIKCFGSKYLKSSQKIVKSSYLHFEVPVSNQKDLIHALFKINWFKLRNCFPRWKQVTQRQRRQQRRRRRRQQRRQRRWRCRNHRFVRSEEEVRVRKKGSARYVRVSGVMKTRKKWDELFRVFKPEAKTEELV